MSKRGKTEEIAERFEEIIKLIRKESPIYSCYSRRQLNGLLENSNHNLIKHLEAKNLLGSPWNARRGRLYKEGRLLLKNNYSLILEESTFIRDKEHTEMLLDIQKQLSDISNEIDISCGELIINLDNKLKSKRNTLTNLHNNFQEMDFLSSGQFVLDLERETMSIFKQVQDLFNGYIDFIEEFVNRRC